MALFLRCKCLLQVSHSLVVSPKRSLLQISPIGISLRNFIPADEESSALVSSSDPEMDYVDAIEKACRLGVNVFDMLPSPESTLDAFKSLGIYISPILQNKKSVIVLHLGVYDTAMSTLMVPPAILKSMSDIRGVSTEKPRWYSFSPDFLSLQLRHLMRFISTVRSTGRCDVIALLADPFLAAQKPPPQTSEVKHARRPVHLTPATADAIRHQLIRAATFMEEQVSRGVLAAWGISISGRDGPPSTLFNHIPLSEIDEIARRGAQIASGVVTAGPSGAVVQVPHHFHFLSVPLNLSEHEAYSSGLIRDANDLGLHVLTCRPLATRREDDMHQYRYVEYLNWESPDMQVMVNDLLNVGIAIEKYIQGEMRKCTSAPPVHLYQWCHTVVANIVQLDNLHAFDYVNRVSLLPALVNSMPLILQARGEALRRILSRLRSIVRIISSQYTHYQETKLHRRLHQYIKPGIVEAVPRLQSYTVSQSALAFACSSGASTVCSGLKLPLYTSELMSESGVLVPSLTKEEMDALVNSRKAQWNCPEAWGPVIDPPVRDNIPEEERWVPIFEQLALAKAQELDKTDKWEKHFVSQFDGVTERLDAAIRVAEDRKNAPRPRYATRLRDSAGRIIRVEDEAGEDRSVEEMHRDLALEVKKSMLNETKLGEADYVDVQRQLADDRKSYESQWPSEEQDIVADRKDYLESFIYNAPADMPRAIDEGCTANERPRGASKLPTPGLNRTRTDLSHRFLQPDGGPGDRRLVPGGDDVTHYAYSVSDPTNRPNGRTTFPSPIDELDRVSKPHDGSSTASLEVISKFSQNSLGNSEFLKENFQVSPASFADFARKQDMLEGPQQSGPPMNIGVGESAGYEERDAELSELVKKSRRDPWYGSRGHQQSMSPRSALLESMEIAEKNTAVHERKLREYFHTESGEIANSMGRRSIHSEVARINAEIAAQTEATGVPATISTADTIKRLNQATGFHRLATFDKGFGVADMDTIEGGIPTRTLQSQQSDVARELQRQFAEDAERQGLHSMSYSAQKAHERLRLQDLYAESFKKRASAAPQGDFEPSKPYARNPSAEGVIYHASEDPLGVYSSMSGNSETPSNLVTATAGRDAFDRDLPVTTSFDHPGAEFRKDHERTAAPGSNRSTQPIGEARVEYRRGRSYVNPNPDEYRGGGTDRRSILVEKPSGSVTSDDFRSRKP